jgi:hypothetical protein
MNRYLVQITNEDIDELDTIDTSKFQLLEAKNSQEAGLKPLRKAGAIKALVENGHTIVFSYVGKADGPKYPNGVPMLLERFELEIGDEKTSKAGPALLPYQD